METPENMITTIVYSNQMKTRYHVDSESLVENDDRERAEGSHSYPGESFISRNVTT